MIRKYELTTLPLVLSNSIDMIDDLVRNGHGGNRPAFQYSSHIDTVEFDTPLEVARGPKRNPLVCPPFHCVCWHGLIVHFAIGPRRDRAVLFIV